MFTCNRWNSPASQENCFGTACLIDAAKALSLGRTSIYVMIGDGRLEAFKLGRRTLIRMESIRRVVAGTSELK